MLPTLMDAQHWRDRAEEARAQAELFQAPAARQALLKIAEDCDRLAEQAERLEKSGHNPTGV
jgi:hypothetical protein